MKKTKLYRSTLGLLASAMLLAGSIMVKPMEVYAAPEIKATVSGTVQKGTDSNTLYLKTPQGDMIIKLDADTQASCKLLLPGSTIYVGVYYGSDAYMHAATISSNNTTTVDTSGYKTSTVSGTISDKPMDGDIIYVMLGNDEMHLKLDPNTDYSGCGVLYAGKSVTIQVYRGNDAYMHALKISDGNGASVSYSGQSTTTYGPGNVKTTPVTGTVNKASTGSMLILDAKEGSYQLKLDPSTSCANGYMLMYGKTITANIYRGDDAYMHVASLSRTGNLSSTSSGSTSMTFTGTINSDSTDGTMYLQTSGGRMTIRLDANTQYTGSTPLYTGTKVSVAAVNCSDEYWHATSITITK